MQWADRIGRRLKLRDLHVLMTVVNAGTMAKAARQLAVSQPVVSKTITDLEHALGVKLLDRSRNGIEPTLYGRALLKHGTAVFDELRQSVEEIKFLSDPTVGELRIGCTDAGVAGLLPAVISRMHRRYPKLSFHLRHATSGGALHRLLRERDVELVIARTASPLGEPDLNVELLMDDPIVVVAGSQSPWLRRRKIDIADLIDEPWILPPPDSVTGSLIRETFRACGLAMPRGVVMSTSLPLIALLQSGPYLAMWPASVLRFGAKILQARVLPVDLPVLPRPFGVITLKGRTISPLAHLFIEYTRKMAKPIGD